MTEQEKLNLYKGYRIQALGTFPMFKIAPPGSGTVPKNLIGTYTTVEEAKRAIDLSLSKLVKKRKITDDQKESTTAR